MSKDEGAAVRLLQGCLDEAVRSTKSLWRPVRMSLRSSTVPGNKGRKDVLVLDNTSVLANMLKVLEKGPRLLVRRLC